MNLYTTSGDNALFNLLGRIFALGGAVDAARVGSVATKRTALEGVLDLVPEAQPALTGCDSWNLAGDNLQGQLAAVAGRLLRRYIQEKGLVFRTTGAALETLRGDLVAGGYYFAASTKSLTVSPSAGNQGDTIVAVSDRNGYGEPVWVFPETVTLRSDGSVITVAGQNTVSRYDETWPSGSGAYFSMLPSGVSQSRVQNAGFETASSANSPADWLIQTGTPGTTVLVPEPEEQQIAITGGPTGGYFVLTWTDPTGKLRQTGSLGPSSSAANIQTALRSIPGLGSVTVTGTNPYTVTFEDTPGDINALGVINRLTGGTSPQVTVTTTRSGDVLNYRGRGLKLAGNAAEQTTLYQSVSLQPGRVYFLMARARRTGSATGELRFELRRAISDSTLADSAGTLNRITVSVADLSTTGHTAITGTFRLPADYGNEPAVFAITAGTPISNGQAVGIDELILVEGTELYPGGPWIAAASGWRPSAGDSWTITAGNNLAGKWEVALERYFQWRAQLRRAPPASGTTQIPDSLLA
jgi:hypothetical protein